MFLRRSGATARWLLRRLQPWDEDYDDYQYSLFCTCIQSHLHPKFELPGASTINALTFSLDVVAALLHLHGKDIISSILAQECLLLEDAATLREAFETRASAELATELNLEELAHQERTLAPPKECRPRIKAY